MPCVRTTTKDMGGAAARGAMLRTSSDLWTTHGCSSASERRNWKHATRHRFGPSFLRTASGASSPRGLLCNILRTLLVSSTAALRWRSTPTSSHRPCVRSAHLPPTMRPSSPYMPFHLTVFRMTEATIRTCSSTSLRAFRSRSSTLAKTSLRTFPTSHSPSSCSMARMTSSQRYLAHIRSTRVPAVRSRAFISSRMPSTSSLRPSTRTTSFRS
mmetsp:Transcript_2262/g.8065  ORF Transcript_2262/g.8065 Transcript_2262/m.8065 type:complete len:213 (+) Transcript_2262:286-924(+)